MLKFVLKPRAVGGYLRLLQGLSSLQYYHWYGIKLFLAEILNAFQDPFNNSQNALYSKKANHKIAISSSYCIITALFLHYWYEYLSSSWVRGTKKKKNKKKHAVYI